MAGTQHKRPREESCEEEAEANRVESDKRQNTYNSILSILENEQEYDPNQDLSAIFTTLQQELSCSSSTYTSTTTTFDFDYLPSTTEEEAELGLDYQHDQAAGGGGGKEDDEEKDDGVRVMKHLLEASDDELGIPNRADEETNSGENPPPSALSDGPWELEDETANYYTILQSEFFM
ncbi:uncharacterized protein LOC111395287 [Olea europaea var. sylvestris]|uniref:uncharacterized protein LOC111395287 n=1 Tax=Olea europaea var. sylvestris TaxID=158386 RepID=UPI000C1D4958|nr:uncharacterized protein LOC111395287 [Olea europaea var. sylvestris]